MTREDPLLFREEQQRIKSFFCQKHGSGLPAHGISQTVGDGPLEYLSLIHISTGNFSAFAPWAKLLLSFDMLAGRLEIFPMLLLFVPSTWRGNRLRRWERRN